MLFLLADWLDLPLIWIYLAVCEAALRGVTSGVTQAMLPRALVADGSGNAPIRVSTDGKAGCISTTGDAAHAHKLPVAADVGVVAGVREAADAAGAAASACRRRRHGRYTQQQCQALPSDGLCRGPDCRTHEANSWRPRSGSQDLRVFRSNDIVSTTALSRSVLDG